MSCEDAIETVRNVFRTGQWAPPSFDTELIADSGFVLSHAGQNEAMKIRDTLPPISSLKRPAGGLTLVIADAGTWIISLTQRDAHATCKTRGREFVFQSIGGSWIQVEPPFWSKNLPFNDIAIVQRIKWVGYDALFLSDSVEDSVVPESTVVAILYIKSKRVEGFLAALYVLCPKLRTAR